MWGWWKYLDSVSTFNKWMQLAAAFFAVITAIAAFSEKERIKGLIKFFGVLTAFFGLLLWFSGDRKDQLQSDKDKSSQHELQETRRKLDESEKNLQEFKEKVIDRKVPRDRFNEFISNLSQWKGENILVCWLNGNSEAQNFANEIGLIFKMSGWNIKGASVTRIGGGALFDAEISARNEEFLQKAMHITSVLDFIKFKVTPTNEKISENIVITIGQKPVR